MLTLSREEDIEFLITSFRNRFEECTNFVEEATCIDMVKRFAVMYDSRELWGLSGELEGASLEMGK